MGRPDTLPATIWPTLRASTSLAAWTMPSKAGCGGSSVQGGGTGRPPRLAILEGAEAARSATRAGRARSRTAAPEQAFAGSPSAGSPSAGIPSAGSPSALSPSAGSPSPGGGGSGRRKNAVGSSGGGPAPGSLATLPFPLPCPEGRAWDSNGEDTGGARVASDEDSSSSRARVRPMAPVRGRGRGRGRRPLAPAGGCGPFGAAGGGPAWWRLRWRRELRLRRRRRLRLRGRHGGFAIAQAAGGAGPSGRRCRPWRPSSLVRSPALRPSRDGGRSGSSRSGRWSPGRSGPPSCRRSRTAPSILPGALSPLPPRSAGSGQIQVGEQAGSVPGGTREANVALAGGQRAGTVAVAAASQGALRSSPPWGSARCCDGTRGRGRG